MVRMQHSILAFFAVVLVGTTLLPSFSAEAGPQKRALVIGVNGYQKGRDGDLAELHTTRDLEAVSQALQSEKFGFKQSSIRTLASPDETTHKSITAALQQLAQETRAGDIVFIHFSGHGSQVPDDDSQEEPDGLDETLVPSDYDSSSESSRIKSQIRDDEVGELIDAILAKNPLLLTACFDCCCSGGNTRGVELKRGFPWQGALSLGAKSGSDNSFADRSDKNFVAIYAALPDENAWETFDDSGKPMGLLSYALAKTLQTADNQTTYQDLFDKVSLSFLEKNRTNQHPQIEGRLENVIMSGNVLKTEPLVKVTVINNKVILRAGNLSGVTEGSVYELFPANTKSIVGAKAFGKFTVGATDFISAVLDPVDGSFLPEGVSLARAKEISHNYGKAQIALSLEGFTGIEADRISANLEKTGGNFLRHSGANEVPDIRLIAEEHGLPSKSTNQIPLRIERRNGSVIEKMKIELSEENEVFDTSKLVSVVKDELRWQHLIRLENHDSERNVNVEFRLVPLNGVKTNAKNEITATETGIGEPQSGTAKLPNKQFFGLEARCGPGSRRAYINVFCLSANGRIDPMYPIQLKSGLHDNYIDPDGKWHRLSPGYHMAEKPAGDIFKLVATETWCDFSPLFTGGRSKDARHNSNPIENLFLAANETTKVATSFKIAPSGWSTAEIVLADVTDEQAR